jgi:hypothetical protein
VKPTPHASAIRLSRGASAPTQPEIAAPSLNINLDQATKAIDSTTKTAKKKPEIATPSF